MLLCNKKIKKQMNVYGQSANKVGKHKIHIVIHIVINDVFQKEENK